MIEAGSLVLLLSYVLLVIAAVTAGRMPRLLLASLGVALGLLAFLWDGDVQGLVVMVLLLVCCLVVLGRDTFANARARFSAEEEPMLAGFLAGVPRHLARHLIDRGVWINGSMGEEITREGVPVERIVFLASGEALVLSDGRQVATCRAGDLIGEATVLTAEPATASVVLAGAARFWCMGAEELRAYLEVNPELRSLLERSFARAVRNKLHASNRTIAAAGGVA